LPRALEEAGAKVGDSITVTRVASKPVTVEEIQEQPDGSRQNRENRCQAWVVQVENHGVNREALIKAYERPREKFRRPKNPRKNRASVGCRTGPSGCRVQARETRCRAKPAQPAKSHRSVDAIMNVELNLGELELIVEALDQKHDALSSGGTEVGVTGVMEP
jgi:hypothetical protein